mmetsp:Transcript_7849/g.19502  ORF Transcript_7849/g.19502 Transcript_7849/m.19502 type:complete len:272 (+) Transcript_7849:1160-1975(+)
MRVAIIDMQVFQPEVIPVLSALTDPELLSHLESIAFSGSLISPPPEEPKYLDGSCTDGSVEAVVGAVEAVVGDALERTQLNIVSRLPGKQALISRIAALARKNNLYGTQLSASAAALSNSLHCTQGPPRTGKSYLGVLLIQALDMIRTAALREGVLVGPIIVLPYKNHALDEILLDVLKQSGLRKRELIRCGRTEEETLSEFVEQNSHEERAARGELSRRVACMRALRRSVRDLPTLRSSFLDTSSIALRTWAPSRKHEKPSTSGLEFATF